jgi:hypothetical protein
MSSLNMDHVTYILGLFSLAFIFYLFVNLLLSLYDNSGRNAPTSVESDVEGRHLQKSKFEKHAGAAYIEIRPESRLTMDSDNQDEFELADPYWAEQVLQ